MARGLYVNGEYKLARTCNANLVAAAGTGFTIGAGTYDGFFLTFSPTQVSIWGSAIHVVTAVIPNSAEISSLWDTVRIDKVEIYLSAGGSDQAPTVGVVMPRIYIADDFTDGTTGTTLAQVQQQGNCRWINLSNDNGIAKHTVYPKHLRVIFFNAVTSSYEPARGFISSGTDVPHYGTRLAVDATKLASTGLQMTFKLFFTCKNVK